MIEIRPIRVEEFERFRTLRLLALRESPDAFGSIESVEALMGLDLWKLWCSDRPERRVLVAVREDGTWVGTASVAPYQGKPELLGIFAVWVAPAVRRQGVGRRLIEGLLAFGATTERKRARVHVGEPNDPALSLFFFLGFEDTKERYSLREDLKFDAFVLERRLDLPVVAMVPALPS